MLLLSKDFERSFLASVLKVFTMDKAEALVYRDELKQALAGSYEPLFYHMLYNINEAHDADFALKVFDFSFKIYLAYRAELDDDASKKELDRLFEQFFRGTYGIKCADYLRSDRRDEAAINVLQHVSERMNNVLALQQEMIINLSHAMRTSLNGILGYLNALQNEAESMQKNQRYYLKKSYGESLELEALVGKILDMSKINAGQMELNKEAFWLEDALSQSVDRQLPLLRKKQLEFETRYDLFEQQYVGDRKYISLVVTHLLQNAIKYTSYGHISLRVSSKKADEYSDELTFTLQDTGQGMDSKQLKLIRDPFVRFSAMHNISGSGLYIASKLIKKMHGSVEVSSKKGEGTTISFTLKLVRVENPEVDLSSQYFLFYNEAQPLDRNMFEQLKKFLVHHGAHVWVIEDEKELMGTLMGTLSERTPEVPTCFVLTSKEENHERNNALIHYLKSMPRFKETHFLAQYVLDHTQVSFFDYVFSGNVPLSYYLTLSCVDKKAENIVSEPSKDNTIRILAVDDIITNLEVLQLFTKMLFPHAVLDIASGGYEAMGMYKMVDYDLIFLDLKMPGQTGYDVIEVLSKIKPLPPTFALTADVYKRTFEKISKAGFDGLLEKPIQPDVLKETIRKVLHAKTYR